MRSLNRREFMKRTAGVAAAFTALSQRKVRGANDKVVIAVMGLGGRGTYLAESFAERPDVEVAYL
ncbi:MAG: twin-arginine translocation signal domain-containing protein, partial [Planctomycetota bacterium]